MTLRINDIAPDFTVESTEGRISFHDWIGDGYAVLFSHPKDFTPVCTTEFGAVSRLAGEFARRGCKVALGIDGQAFDEDDDALRELRLLWSLHAGWGFDADATPRDILRMALENGREALGAPAGGRLEPGAPADLLILDRAALDEDALMEVDPLDMMFARANRSHVRELIVAGRTVVSRGRVLGVDLEAAHRELRAAYRAGLPARAGFAAALPAFEREVARHYLDRLGCC